MSKKLLTKDLSIDRAKEFVNSFNDNNYYLATFKQTPFFDEINIDPPKDTESYITSLYKQMIFGKKISNNDIVHIIPRHNWTYGEVYTEYDDNDSSIYDKNFYAIVQEGDNYHTYKCIFNNNNANSIAQPTFSSTDYSDDIYETSDGYIWKYMYSVNTDDVAKFSTIEYFPVKLNANATQNAKVGTIDNIKIVNAGSNYNNYISGMNYFGSNQIRLNGNTVIYDISSNSFSSTTNDYYNGCYIYVTSGTGSGQYKKIIDYVVNSTARSIILESEFEIPISIDSSYNIYPGVVIYGSDTQTTNAIAIAVVNNVSNTINKINMLNIGRNYQEAYAYVYSHPSVGSSNSELRVIISPYSGHGYDSISELNGRRICVGLTISNSENNTIPTSNDYRIISILKNPLYANVNIETSTKDGNFINNEKVVNIRPRLLNSNITMNSSCNYVNSTSTNFNLQLSLGEYVYIRKNNLHYIDYVSEISNNYIVLNSNVSFNSNSTSQANLYVTDLYVNSYVITSNVTNVLLSNVPEPIYTLDKFIGMDSKAYLEVSNISISNTNKSFNTFINMYKFDGNLISGSFEEDEIVTQDNASGKYNSTMVSNGVTSFYLTEVSGNIVANGTSTIIGETSGAIATLTNKYLPELVFKSGDILFIENMIAISRDPLQSERFKLIFEF